MLASMYIVAFITQIQPVSSVTPTSMSTFLAEIGVEPVMLTAVGASQEEIARGVGNVAESDYMSQFFTLRAAVQVATADAAADEDDPAKWQAACDTRAQLWSLIAASRQSFKLGLGGDAGLRAERWWTAPNHLPAYLRVRAWSGTDLSRYGRRFEQGGAVHAERRTGATGGVRTSEADWIDADALAAIQRLEQGVAARAESLRDAVERLTTNMP